MSSEQAERFAKPDGAEPAVMGERRMKNWWQIDGTQLENDVVLLKLLEQTKAYVDS